MTIKYGIVRLDTKKVVLEYSDRDSCVQAFNKIDKSRRDFYTYLPIVLS